MKKIKGLLKSKTFWLNVIGGAAQIINATSGHWIPVEQAAGIQAILNVIVRMMTNKPLDDK